MDYLIRHQCPPDMRACDYNRIIREHFIKHLKKALIQHPNYVRDGHCILGYKTVVGCGSRITGKFVLGCSFINAFVDTMVDIGSVYDVRIRPFSGIGELYHIGVIRVNGVRVIRFRVEPKFKDSKPWILDELVEYHGKYPCHKVSENEVDFILE